MKKELHEKMALVQYLLYKKRKRATSDGEYDPAHGQGRILAMLKMRDGVSVRDLAYLLDLAPSTMSEFLVKLEKSELISRESVEGDKRINIIKLTDKGRAVEQRTESEEDGLYDCFGENEQKEFGEYLDRLTESLKNQLSYDDEKMERKKSKVLNRQKKEKK